MPYWDERFAEMKKRYPDIRTDQYHIDILTAHFVQHPDWFDVVVGSNLFGDILSDLGPGVTGTIAVAPRSEEHTSELQSLMRISYAVFCLKKKKQELHTNKRNQKTRINK